MQKNFNYIKVTLNINECIQQYFNKILNKIDSNIDLIQNERELDYVKMRRFLLTAYNDLLELDFSFQNKQLMEVKNYLDKIYSQYLYFKNETKFPKRAYENIFLNRQLEYKRAYEIVKSNKLELLILDTKIKSTEISIEETKNRLKKISRTDNQYNEITKNLKHLKATLVDAIHKRANLLEENHLLIKLTNEFYTKNYEEFEKIFQDFSQTNILKLKMIQDKLAYKFDTMIWEKANKSKTIKRFFHQAGIIEEFSSVTFLKYYLKRLDDKKLSLKHKELRDLLKYLEILKKNVILCLDDDIEFLYKFKDGIYSISRENLVITTTQAGEAIESLKKDHPNILMINPNTKRVNVKQILNFTKDKLKHIKIIFFSNSISHEELTLAKEFNVIAILKKSFREDNLQKEISKILNN